MKKLLSFFSCVFVYLLITASAIAQSGFFRFTHYRSEQGLQQSVIRKILQDKNGYIWIATEDGLQRFDAYSFKVYRKKQNINSLSWNHIYCMQQDEKTGLLWLGTSFNGINILNPATDSIVHLSETSKDEGLIDGNITCISILHEHVIAGTKKGVSIINKGTYKVENNIATKSEVRSIYYDSLSGKTLIFCKDGETLLLDKMFTTIRNYSSEDFFQTKLTDVWEVSRTTNGLFWFCTKQGLYTAESFDKIIQKQVQQKEIVINGKNYSSKNYTSVFQDSKDRYWVSVDSIGLILFSEQHNPQQVVRHNPDNANSLGDVNVTQIFEDQQHNLWFATEKGLDKISYTLPFISTYGSENERLSNLFDRIFAIYTPDDKNIFLAQLGHISVFNRETNAVKEVANQTGIDIARIYFINPYKENTWLVGCREGVMLLTLTNDRYELNFPLVFPELLGIKKRASTICQLSDGNYLLGTIQNGGLFYWQSGIHSLQHFLHDDTNSNSIADDNINCITKGKDGTIWIGTSKGFSSFDVQKNIFLNRQITLNNKSLESTINDIYDDGKYLWLAAYQEGIVRWDKLKNIYKIYSEETGLPSATIYNIRPDKLGNLWISSNAGLIMFNTATEKFKLFNKEDGLQDNEFNRFAIYATEKNLYFGGISGLSIIEKNKIKSTEEFSSVNITTVNYLANHQYINLPGIPASVKLPSRNNSFEIHFSSLNFSNPHKDQYDYMLKGWDKDWIYASTRHDVNYSNIPPGHYTFKVKSAGADNSKVTSLSITIVAAWYQTILFKAIMILLMVGTIYSFYNIRRGQKKRLERIRAGISSDLHDEIGATLSSVNIYAGLAKKEINKSSHLDSITQNISEVVNKLDDLVWSINPKFDSTVNIISRLQSYAEPICHAKEIEFQIKNSLSESDLRLSAEVKHNIYLVIKELINNSIKHSGCSNIQVDISRQKNRLFLSVSDDGKGFNKDTIRKDRNGLSNIFQRVAAIKGVLNTETSNQNGTKTSISIPV